MQNTVNETRNNGGSVTEVLPGTAGLATLRNKYGHDTPAGRRCSNILEMMDAGARPSDIAIQVHELASLLPKGEH